MPTSAKRWHDLRALWGVIDRGSSELGVHTFNGGLFDPEKHPFLERYAVGDRRLQEAIDNLARVGGEWVDYRDLSERHLGTIYEGLLEYHLEPLTGEEQDGQGWAVQLAPDNRERKVTGSYYTPDYIVQYIADRTLRPVLRAAVEGKYTDEEKVAAVLALNVLDPAMGSGHFLVEATEYLARFLVELNVLPEADRAEADTELAYWKRRVVQSCIYGVDLNPLAVELAKLSLWLSTVAQDRPLSFLDHHLRAGNALVGARIEELQRLGSSTAKPVRRAATRKGREQVAAGQAVMFDDDAFRQSMSTAVDSMWLIEGSPARTVEEVKQQERVYAGLREELTRRYARLANLVTATYFSVAVDPSLWEPLADYASGWSLAAPARFGEWLEASEAEAAGRRFFHWELEFPEVFYDAHGGHKGDAAGFNAVIGNPPYVRQESLGPLAKAYFAAGYPETYHGVADLYVYFYQQGLRLLRAGGRMSYIVTNKWMRAGYGEPLRAFFAEQRALEQIVDFGHAPVFADADVFPCILVLQKPEPDTGPPIDDLAPPGPRARPDAPPSADVPTNRTDDGAGVDAGVRAGVDTGVGAGDRTGVAAGDRTGVQLNAPTPPPGANPDTPASQSRQVHVVSFPREALGTVDLSRYLEEHAHPLPLARFGRGAWTLETSAVDDLMEKIRRVGVPLAEYAGVKPLYGIKTGLNEAFLIYTPTRERLVREDPRSAAIIKPYLRGQDIKRWSPEWRGLWMIVLKSSGDHAWPWSDADDGAEEVFRQTYPSLYGRLKPMEAKLRKRQDKGRYWWELRPCGYYDAFERPKIITQDLATYSWFCLDEINSYTVNTCYIWPSADLYMLGWLCSPLAWWLMHRTLQHAINDTLRMFSEQVETLPIAPPTDAAREEAAPAVGRLIEIARSVQDARRATLDWLRVEFAVATPGQKLEEYAALDADAFVEEVRKRRPRSAGRLGPGALADLRRGYAEQAAPVRAMRTEAAALERRLSELVNAAYHLTPEEEALLWATAPPRMPRF